MKRVVSSLLASVLSLSASAAFAQTKPPLKLDAILDMSGLYAESVSAAFAMTVFEPQE